MKDPKSEIMGRYLAEIRRFPLLSREQEARLVRLAQRGRIEARDRLIEANQRFVVKVAYRYRRFGMPVEDLVSEGNLGLITAIQCFDPGRGVRLIHWARWWVKRAIRRALTDQSRIVRLPESALRKIREVRDAVHELTHTLGRAPTAAEVETELRDVEPLYRHGFHISSLDASAGDGADDGLAAALHDPGEPSPEDRLLAEEATEWARRAYDRLEGKERDIIGGRYGLDDGQSTTLEALGRRHGHSREGVRFIERRAIRKLARHLRKHFDGTWIPSSASERAAARMGGVAGGSSPAG